MVGAAGGQAGKSRPTLPNSPAVEDLLVIPLDDMIIAS